MNLISCKKCGVVLDKSCLEFPDFDAVEIDIDRDAWNGAEWIPTVPCPVCGGKILEKDY